MLTGGIGAILIIMGRREEARALAAKTKPPGDRP
jgi:hypothetical protein